MLTSDEEHYILSHAYVPEHIAGLMTYLSGGEPFLIEDYLCCCKKDRIILVGYPLQRDFILEKLESVIEKIKKKYRPAYISLIAPQMPPKLSAACQERESDFYYTLDPQKPTIRSVVKRNLKKARHVLTVERSFRMLESHHELMLEFVASLRPPARVEELLFKMMDYVGLSDNAVVLNAWDSNDRLAAFYVVDLAAKAFSSYIIGCYSKKNYILGASDLLLYELIELSIEYEKSYIHLGLGVNEGIRRFKVKWGGKPTYRYEMCELVYKKPSILETIMTIKKFK